MANPDKDDGFFLLAYELTAAILIRGLGRDEGLVAFEVFAQIYGWAKLPHATLKASDIARRSGRNKSNILRAIRNLIDAGILVKVGATAYKFVKDHACWQLPGETPERRQAAVSYALHAPTLVKAYRNSSQPTTVGEGVSKMTPYKRSSGVKNDTRQLSESVRNDTQKVSEMTPPGDPPLCTPPEVLMEKIENHHPRREEDEEDRSPRGVGVTTGGMTSTPTPEPPGAPSPSRNGSVPLRSAARPGHTPEQVAGMDAWAREILGERYEQECLHGKLAAYARSYELSWIEEAVLVAKASARVGGLDAYINKLLREWYAAGGVPRAPQPGASGHAVASPGPARKTFQERDREQSEAIRRSAARIAAMDFDEENV